MVLAVNPKRQVPVLIDGDLALFELDFDLWVPRRPAAVSAAIPGRHTDAGALSPIRADR